MTVLQNWSGQENMPVEQNKKTTKLLKQDSVWQVDERLMNFDQQHHPLDYNTLKNHPVHHSHNIGLNPQETSHRSDNYYENDSYNNNNNVKYNSTIVNVPHRRYSEGVQPSQLYLLSKHPNGHLEDDGTGGVRSNTRGSTGSGAPKPKHHVPTYRQHSSPDMGRAIPRNLDNYGNSSNYWNASSFAKFESPYEVGHEGSPAERTVPDGYATVGRVTRGVAKDTKNPPLKKVSESGQSHVYHSYGNGLHLINGPEFLAHSLALSNTSDGEFGQSQTVGNSERLGASHQDSPPAGRQEKQKLNQTMSTLPQHEYQVQHERVGYLKQSSPLSKTQPLPIGPQVVHSAPATPQGDSFPGFSRQFSSGSGSSTPTSSNGGDIPLKKQSVSNKSPLHTISESIKSRVKNPKLGRSNSTPNLLEELEKEEDIDQDDYGFQSYRSFRTKTHPFKDKSSPSSAMHKSSDDQAQSSRTSRKWKKSKLTQTKSVPTSSWKPQVRVRQNIARF